MENSMHHLKTYSVDRFEGRYVILEDENGKIYDVLREELPEDIREGDILRDNGGYFFVDEEETAKQRKKLKEIFDNIVKKY